MRPTLWSNHRPKGWRDRIRPLMDRTTSEPTRGEWRPQRLSVGQNGKAKRDEYPGPNDWNLSGHEGPPGGRFRLPTSEEEGSCYELKRGENRDRIKRYKRDKKYGHQENDLEFFKSTFQDEVCALQQLDLGDDFRYPSDEAFARYFPEFDFLKAMRGNSLRKWDGTVRGLSRIQTQLLSDDIRTAGALPA